MKMILSKKVEICLVASFFLFLFFNGISFGAPAMRGIAINEATKECGGYWGGDEYKQYSLPSGWTAYYPVEESGSYFFTIGDKKIEDVGKTNIINCERIGYKYVGENVGDLPSAGARKDLILYIGGGVILVGGVFFAVKIFRKNKV